MNYLFRFESTDSNFQSKRFSVDSVETANIKSCSDEVLTPTGFEKLQFNSKTAVANMTIDDF